MAGESSCGAIHIKEFRTIVLAQTLSLFGDQIGRVAVAALVYQRTHSAALSAGSFAVTYLPYLIGGSILAVAADRYPRRAVMVACDVARAAIVALIAVPLPALVLVALMFLATLLTSPFEAARSATLPEVLRPGRQLESGIGWIVVNTQVMSMLGFLLGGAALAVVTAPNAVLFDSLTYLASAGLLLTGLGALSPVNRRARSTWAQDVASGAALVFRNRALVVILTVALLSASLVVVPEGLAIPYMAELRAPEWALGSVMATLAAGLAAGAMLAKRLPRWSDLPVLVGATLAAAVPLFGFFAHPNIYAALGLVAASSLAQGVAMVKGNVAFVERVSPQNRGKAMGLAGVVLMGGQGIAMLIGGVAANYLKPSLVIAWLPAVVIVCLAAFWWLFAKNADGRQARLESADAGQPAPQPVVA